MPRNDQGHCCDIIQWQVRCKVAEVVDESRWRIAISRSGWRSRLNLPSSVEMSQQQRSFNCLCRRPVSSMRIHIPGRQKISFFTCILQILNSQSRPPPLSSNSYRGAVKMPYYKYYHYDPSLAASIIFAILFGLTAGWHIFLLVRNRTWYFIPVVVGGICAFPSRSIPDNQSLSA